MITLSLIGIIYLQISWLKNLVDLREDQVKQKIDDIWRAVGRDLITYRPMSPAIDNGLHFRERTLNEMLYPPTIGSRLTREQIHAIIRKRSDEAGLTDLKYEFSLLSEGRTGIVTPERQSVNFAREYLDSSSNYVNTVILSSYSGTAFDNLSDESLILVALDYKRVVFMAMTWNIVLAVAFSLVILSAFYTTIYTMLRQKKLSDIKNDFINNMTHELKTPIATISLAVDALKNEKVLADKNRLGYFSGIIKEENQRMNKHVETILKASQFEKQEVELDLKHVHVHQVIRVVADKFKLQLDEKHGAVELYLDALNDLINADEAHFTNLINNLVDNAVKYSKENVPLLIKISTLDVGKKLQIKVEDNGIGMSKETQRRVFEKFYRAHTGNLHNVKGFGLGLNYVKSVADSHHATVKVESVLGKGSAFTIDFPLVQV